MSNFLCKLKEINLKFKKLENKIINYQICEVCMDVNDLIICEICKNYYHLNVKNSKIF